ncbi:noncompact myelin-associated protein isoform X1 [Chiloscyllium punctatum]|uniref:noncompact myelin-associated protein isoform X1 n=1 Tax=Chiloscyllium punctatum TaxID=137246 RepID=UPI003B6416E1
MSGTVMISMTVNTTEVNITTMATKSPEEILYQSSGAIVAVIVIGVIIILTLVLLTLKHYNRQSRLKRDLAPKSSKQLSNPLPQTGLDNSRQTSQVSSSLNIPLERK